MKNMKNVAFVLITTGLISSAHSVMAGVVFSDTRGVEIAAINAQPLPNVPVQKIENLLVIQNHVEKVKTADLALDQLQMVNVDPAAGDSSDDTVILTVQTVVGIANTGNSSSSSVMSTIANSKSGFTTINGTNGDTSKINGTTTIGGMRYEDGMSRDNIQTMTSPENQHMFGDSRFLIPTD